MACYLHCDYLASYFDRWSIPVKCVCDAGAFLDIDTVTGAGNVMRERYALPSSPPPPFPPSPKERDSLSKGRQGTVHHCPDMTSPRQLLLGFTLS